MDGAKADSLAWSADAVPLVSDSFMYATRESSGRDAIICDNKKPGSPCGADQPADYVLRCGDVHDQITVGQRTPCAEATSEYSEAHPHCCVVVGTASHTASLSAIGAFTTFFVLVAMVIDV